MYCMMFIAKHDLIPRIGRMSLLSTRRQSKRYVLSFLQMRRLTRPMTFDQFSSLYKQPVMPAYDSLFQASHLWMPSYKLLMVARCTGLQCLVRKRTKLPDSSFSVTSCESSSFTAATSIWYISPASSSSSRSVALTSFEVHLDAK